MKKLIAMTFMILIGTSILVLPCFAEQMIYGCYKKNNGQLRVVENPSKCRPSEVAISWNEIGPQGPKGDTGATGPQGPMGPAGQAGGVSGWELVQGPFVPIGGSGQIAFATVQCPAGKHVLGGGGWVAVEAAGAVIVMNGSYPASPDTWVVYFRNIGTGGSGSINAEAICADVAP